MARRGQDTADKFHQRQKEQIKKDIERQKANKEKVPDIIIACEDEVSAPTYFNLIVSKLIQEKKITQDSFVIADHHHTNPHGVLSDLKSHICDNGKTYKEFKYKWIVIDRDIERVGGGGHTKEDFNNALKDAKHFKVDVAYSNDAFELWYLLHFVYRNTPILRDDLLSEVITQLKRKNPYKFSKLDKNNIKNATYSKHIFEELHELQETAINNAKKLLTEYGVDHNKERDNPSTTVYQLVELLSTLNIQK